MRAEARHRESWRLSGRAGEAAMSGRGRDHAVDLVIHHIINDHDEEEEEEKREEGYVKEM